MLLENKSASSNQSTVERDVIESTEIDVEEASRNSNEFSSTGGYGGVTDEGFSPLGLPTSPQSRKDLKASTQACPRSNDVSFCQTKDLSDPSPLFPDVIDRGIISMEKATKLYRRYVDDLLPVYVVYSMIKHS